MADTHLTGVTIDPSSPAIAQVQGNSTTSEDAKVSLPLWLSEIMEEYKESENDRKPYIPKVPEPDIPEVPVKLMEKKEECYRPLAVSIGPYHYSDREGKLQQVEKLKARMMVKFVDDSVTPIEDLYVNVKDELQKARGCYDESISEKFSDEEFIKMMFIDGCFILQFMHCLNGESEKLEMSDRQIFHVKRDLLLLENQLPFAVLDSLRKQRYENFSDSNEIINNFLSRHIRSSGKPIPKWVRIALTALRCVMISILFPLYPIFLIISSCISYCLSIGGLNLFNDMGKSMTPDTYDTAAYNDVKMAINKQCESAVKRWVYEWKKTYFSNPWTFITVLAASFGLCLAATQTYYTRFPPK